MSFDLETLYNLLPSVYRIRDLQQGEDSRKTDTDCQQIVQRPLGAFLKIIADQIDILEENLAQLYDDQFIETCAEWLIPYIGDLVNYQTPHKTSSISLRSQVAHTINYRQRKGTVLLLEQLVRDTTGWDAHIVERYGLLAATQHMQRVRSENRLTDLRLHPSLTRLNTPFEDLMHTVDVRKPAPGWGGYTIPTIGIFLWRLRSYSLKNTPAMRLRNTEPCYFFSPLKHNLQLFTRPEIEKDATQLAGPRAVAMPLSRPRLTHFLSDYYGPDKSIFLQIVVDGQPEEILPDPERPSNRLQEPITTAGALNKVLDELKKRLSTGKQLDLTMLHKLLNQIEKLQNELDNLCREQLSSEHRIRPPLESFLVEIEDLKQNLTTLRDLKDPQAQLSELEALSEHGTELYNKLNSGEVDPQRISDLITVADLGDEKERDPHKKSLTTWKNMPYDTIAIDPILGRFAFPQEGKGRELLWKRLGRAAYTKLEQVQCIPTFYYGFSADMGGGEYARSLSFTASLKVTKQPTQLKGIQKALDDLQSSTGSIPGGVVEITGGGRMEGRLAIHALTNQRIELRAADFSRSLIVLEDRPDRPGIVISGESGSHVTLNGLVISHGLLRILGRLERLTLRHCTLVPGLSLTEDGKPEYPEHASLVVEDSVACVEIDHSIVGRLQVGEKTQVRITNSIVDATDREHIAYGGFGKTESGEQLPGGPLHIENSTVIGRIYSLAMDLASNTIFLAPVRVVRRQEGCVRFSYIPRDSLTPRRYHCLPSEGEEQSGITLVEPEFTSLRYGNAGYCQLLQRNVLNLDIGNEVEVRPDIEEALEAKHTKDEARIWHGADDGAEMGAFHDLFQPQCETNLRLCLAEYLPFTLEAGIVYCN